MNTDLKPLGKGVDDRRADAVQTAGDLIASAAELAARVQNRKHDLKRALARLLLNIHGDAASVIGHAYNVAVLNINGYAAAIAGKRLVDGVIDDLIHQMVKPRGRGRADVHTRPFSYGLKPFEHLYVARAVFLSYFFVYICHLLPPMTHTWLSLRESCRQMRLRGPFLHLFNAFSVFQKRFSGRRNSSPTVFIYSSALILYLNRIRIRAFKQRGT